MYSLSQFRNGPKHTDLTEKNQRSCGPEGPWHYAGPVVVLQGRKTMSSAESLVLALAQCPRVTTLGDSTAGSSGNPQEVRTDCGIVVNVPQWIDMDPQGKPIDVAGIAPQVKVQAQPRGFQWKSRSRADCCSGALRTQLKTERLPPGGALQLRPGVLRPKAGQK